MPETSPSPAPLRARLRPRAAALYPQLDPHAWYSVEDPHDVAGGVWLLSGGLGDRLLNPGRLYIFRLHLEFAGELARRP